MTNPFSNIEAQLVRSSLATKTDQELAELLERPEQEVIEFIDQITGGGAAARGIRITDAREAVKRMEEERRKLKVKRKPGSGRKPKQIPESEIREQVRRHHANTTAEHQKKKTREREARQRFKTKVIDWTKMKTVLVAKVTYVVVPKEVSQSQAIQQYNQNREHSRDAVFEKDLKKVKTIVAGSDE